MADNEEIEQVEVAEVAEAAVEVDTASDEEQIKVRKGKKRASLQGLVLIKATFNNTIISIADMRGNVVSWASPGMVGFKGSRKSTPYAAQLASEAAGKKAHDMGMRKVDVKVKGAGSGRESAIRALRSSGLEVISIRDVTGVPHNGCRPKKKRRV